MVCSALILSEMLSECRHGISLAWLCASCNSAKASFLNGWKVHAVRLGLHRCPNDCSHKHDLLSYVSLTKLFCCMLDESASVESGSSERHQEATRQAPNASQLHRTIHAHQPLLSTRQLQHHITETGSSNHIGSLITPHRFLRSCSREVHATITIASCMACRAAAVGIINSRLQDHLIGAADILSSVPGSLSSLAALTSKGKNVLLISDDLAVRNDIIALSTGDASLGFVDSWAGSVPLGIKGTNTPSTDIDALMTNIRGFMEAVAPHLEHAWPVLKIQVGIAFTSILSIVCDAIECSCRS